MKENEKTLQQAADFLGKPQSGFKWVVDHAEVRVEMGKSNRKLIIFAQEEKKKIIDINSILGAGIDVELSDTKNFNCCNVSRGRSVITADRMYNGFDYCRARYGFIFYHKGCQELEIEGLKLKCIKTVADPGKFVSGGVNTKGTYYEVMGPADGWIYPHEAV